MKELFIRQHLLSLRMEFEIKVITPNPIFIYTGVDNTKRGVEINPYPFNAKSRAPDAPTGFSIEVTVAEPENFNVEVI